jgi:hypothetical protein
MVVTSSQDLGHSLAPWLPWPPCCSRARRLEVACEHCGRLAGLSDLLAETATNPLGFNPDAYFEGSEGPQVRRNDDHVRRYR